MTLFYEVPIVKLSNVHSPVDLSVRPASEEISTHLFKLKRFLAFQRIVENAGALQKFVLEIVMTLLNFSIARFQNGVAKVSA